MESQPSRRFSEICRRAIFFKLREREISDQFKKFCRVFSQSRSLSADLLNINPSRKAKREYGFCTLFLHNRRLMLYPASTAADCISHRLVQVT